MNIITFTQYFLLPLVLIFIISYITFKEAFDNAFQKYYDSVNWRVFIPFLILWNLVTVSDKYYDDNKLFVIIKDTLVFFVISFILIVSSKWQQKK